MMQIPDLSIPSFDPSSGLLIYGAGKSGRFVLEQCRAAGIPIAAVMDRSTTEFDEGVTFYQFPHYPAPLKELPVIVAVHGEVLDAWNQLADAGFSHLYTMSQFYLFMENRYRHAMPCYACLGHSAEMNSHREEIFAAYELLEDDISRKNFHNQLHYRRIGNVIYLQEPDPGFQYYSINRPFRFQRPINFIDCGAFTGDTLGELATELEFESITAFEPDPKTFQMLRKFIAERQIPGRILTIQGGVGDCNEVLSFSSAQDGCATFGRGELMIPVFSLDSLLCNCRVDFIKMDIEGSEATALHGAAETIRRETPVLAISVYHKPADLWELPLLMKQLYPSAHLFLRTHRGSYHDTVCYAVPDQFLRTR